MQIIADRDLCIGAGRCVQTAPDVFDSDDDGLVDVRTPRPGGTRRPDVETAVRLCPAGALSLEEP